MLNYQRVDLFEDMVSKIPWLIFPWKNWLTFWVSHMFGQTHMIMVVFSRHIPQSLYDHIPILSHCVLYMYTVFTYTYIRMYIYTYIHTCIYDFPNKSMVVSCKHSVYSNLRGVVFFPAPGRPATGSSSVPNQRSHWRATRSAGEKKEGTTDWNG